MWVMCLANVYSLYLKMLKSDNILLPSGYEIWAPWLCIDLGPSHFCSVKFRPECGISYTLCGVGNQFKSCSSHSQQHLPFTPFILISMNSIWTKTDKLIYQFCKNKYEVCQCCKFCMFCNFPSIFIFIFFAVTWCKNENLASISHFQWSLQTAVT